MSLLSATNPADGSSITVDLFSSTMGTPPVATGTATVLATLLDSSLTASLASYSVPLTSTVTLAANTRYWIELVTSGTGRWSFDNSNAGIGVANEYNLFAGTSSANSTFTPYQMQVVVGNAAAAPEPAAMALTTLGLAGLAFLRRRRA